MISNREPNGFRSARKYMASSPLARDSTMQQTPIRKRKDSFSTSHHTHGLGGEAREAMLRNGLRVKRTTSSLRVVATKGNATLTAAFSHNFPVPDLDIYRKNYVRKEGEFAESIPSAMCPFQFLPEDTTDMMQWQRTTADPTVVVAAAADNTEQTPEQDQQIDKWLQDMRLKVHIRLAQKQQFSNTANPIEPIKPGENEDHLPLASPTNHKDKKAKAKENDSASPPTTSRTSRRNSLSRGSNRVSPMSPPKKSERKDKRTSLPPVQRKPSNLPSVSVSVDKPLPKINSHDNSISLHAPGTPLFYSRQEPLLARRTYSEQDVRRVRAKARNSVGLEPAS